MVRSLPLPVLWSVLACLPLWSSPHSCPRGRASLNSELSTTRAGPQTVQGLAPMAPYSSGQEAEIGHNPAGFFNISCAQSDPCPQFCQTPFTGDHVRVQEFVRHMWLNFTAKAIATSCSAVIMSWLSGCPWIEAPL